MKPARIERLALLLIALFMLPAGVQAAFWPRSFFDDFPLGRAWIAAEGGAYNEHLVRDVGALFLALIVATAYALWRRRPLRGLALAWLVQGVLHLVYHVGHLDGYDGVDKVAMIGSLAAIPALAGLALWASTAAPARAGRR